MTGSSEESSRDSFKECYQARTVSFGYRKLEQSQMEENEQSRQGTGSEIDTGVTSLPSPPFAPCKMEEDSN